MAAFRGEKHRQNGFTSSLLPCDRDVLTKLVSSHAPRAVLRCKVVIVGDAATGKTALCRALTPSSSSHGTGATSNSTSPARGATSRRVPFSERYVATETVEYAVRQASVPGTDGAVVAELHLFDMAGQEAFNQGDLAAGYLNAGGCPDVIVCVCAVTSRDSLTSAPRWIRWARGAASEGEGDDTIPVLLVANKIDAREGDDDGDGKQASGRCQVEEEEGQSVASSCTETEYFECSVKCGRGVDVVFDRIVAKAYDIYRDEF